MRRLLAFAVLALIAATQPAAAAVINAIPSPASRNISLNGGTAVTVTWTITRAAGAPFTIQSRPGEFKEDANMIGDWGTTSSITRTYNTSQTSVTIVETFVVPPSVARKALEANNGNFILLRLFTDDNFTNVAAGEIGLHVTGGGDGALAVQEETLTFDNGAATTTVAKDSRLTARAVLNVSGAGQLDAIWEINDSGTGSTTFYRPLKRVTVTLAGQRTAILTSPLLPTKQSGRNDVRLRILSPQTGFDPATIIYFVTGESGATAELRALSTTSPANNAEVTEKTSFSWKGADGAAGYKIEIFTPDNQSRPAAKMMVKGNKTEATLSALTFSKLPAGAYRWRVVAFDKEGRSIAASALKSMYVSE